VILSIQLRHAVSRKIIDPYNSGCGFDFCRLMIDVDGWRSIRKQGWLEKYNALQLFIEDLSKKEFLFASLCGNNATTFAAPCCALSVDVGHNNIVARKSFELLGSIDNLLCLIRNNSRLGRILLALLHKSGRRFFPVSRPVFTSEEMDGNRLVYSGMSDLCLRDSLAGRIIKNIRHKYVLRRYE